MPAHIDKVVKAYREAVAFTSAVSGRILCDEDGLLSVMTGWSQNNIERKCKMTSEMYHTVDVGNKRAKKVGISEVAGSQLIKYSPSLLKCVLREVQGSGKVPNTKQYLEVWRDNLMTKQFDLAGADLHGDVYTDSNFGTLEWSPKEDLVLYLAEKKVPKAESFLSGGKGSSDSKEKSTRGEEYLFVEDWGEQLVGKSHSVLAVADLSKEEVRLVDIKQDQKYFFGSAVWAPGGGVIAVAYVVEPTRLGLVYCTNRKSYIVHITPEGDLFKLSEEGKAVFGPKLSPDESKLVWFQRDVGGPHHSCVTLVCYDWQHKKISTILDVVPKQMTCTGGQPFFGLYNHEKLSSCWLSGSRYLVLNTPQRASVKTFVIDTEEGSVSDITGASDEEYSQGVLHVYKDYVLCWRSSLNLQPGVYLARVDFQQLNNVDWLPIVPCQDINDKYKVTILRLNDESPSPVSSFSAIHFAPSDTSLKVPLIVWSHGGPHSASSNMHNMLARFYSKLGFAILMVNYRGSIGAGKNCVDYLPGKVGSLDVSDVHRGLQEVLKRGNVSKVLAYGGSHGGFLTLHLVGQYPDEFVGCVALNPVTDLPQFSGSDIPDWAYVESGLPYTPLSRLSSAETEHLYKCSPISHVDKVKCPVLLLVGSKDLRVPPTQGVSYYRTLKQIGKVNTKLHLYQDNHPLSQSPHETDFIINAGVWFLNIIHPTDDSKSK